MEFWLGCLFPWIGKAEGGSDSALGHSGKDAHSFGRETEDSGSRGRPSWLKGSFDCLFSLHFLVEKVVTCLSFPFGADMRQHGPLVLWLIIRHP